MDTPSPSSAPTIRQDGSSPVAVKAAPMHCAGLAVMMGVCALFIAAIVLFVLHALRNDEPSQNCLMAAQSSPVLRKELGEPITMGWFPSGSILLEDGEGYAYVNVPVSGPHGSATIHAVGNKKPSQPWVYSEMQATVKKTGQKVDLKKP